MKRAGNLWPQITDFANLLQASRQAQRGKRFRGNVLAFNYRLEYSLERLQRSLLDKTYKPGIYKTFEIYDPKPRLNFGRSIPRPGCPSRPLQCDNADL
jgi:RNA-directed DNA polymerase